MSKNYRRYEPMLFNYETVMRQDFREGAILDVIRTVYKEKPKCLSVRPPPLKDIQTLTDWKNHNIPTELLLKPKEIVRTNPHTIQQHYVAVEDTELERVRRTRPRLVMTPAVSMDDIIDDNKREILIKEMYKSSARSAMEIGIASQHVQSVNVQAPLQGTLSAANPITLKRLQFPYITPEWRMDAVTWDSRQLRAYSDPSKEFYLSRPLRCKFCDETAARDMNRKLKMKRTNM